MQTSHLISDLVLALVGIYVFFRYLAKLDVTSTILWESFILSVAVAAGFGALGYAGVERGHEISRFFQKLAATVGALGLVAGAYQLASGRQISRTASIAIIVVGFIMLAISEWYDMSRVRDTMSLIGLPLVGILGLWAMSRGNKTGGGLLVGGVVFTSLAVASTKLIASPTDSIDAYHYLLAIGLLCFGLAAASQRLSRAENS